MGLFEVLTKKKDNGEELKIEELSSDDLRKLYIEENKTDFMIADLFNVKKSKVTYLRRKMGISIRNAMIDDYLANQTEAAEVNRLVKEKILVEDNIDMISKAITHFAFRNGPVEDMHADPDSQLSDSDMKTLNKYMVNRLAYVFTLIIENRRMEFDYLIKNLDFWAGHNWDKAEPDDGGIREEFEEAMRNMRNFRN
ncbi:hypothetical protein GCM10008967_39980 [Bacillus carboniphilus]|uniref:Uncharacterized protein n=1 Tax=Bacillus carboniphilus TaxID=86663 RepID=A0ABP3GH82_9BACI